MVDAIRPEDVPQPLLDAAQTSQLLPGEGAVESDVYLRRQLAAVLTQTREMIACALDDGAENVVVRDTDVKFAIAAHETFEMAAGIARTWPGGAA